MKWPVMIMSLSFHNIACKSGILECVKMFCNFGYVNIGMLAYLSFKAYVVISIVNVFLPFEHSYDEHLCCVLNKGKERKKRYSKLNKLVFYEQ